ncbi:hypothetical protein R5H32_20045, partial [Defluviimonas sp. D31]|nr:hypothetical protein [Defluviimonas sp. D31]
MTGVLTTIRFLTPTSARAGATGLILAFAWAGHGIGGYAGGLLFDLTGTYDLTFLAAAAAGAVNLAIVAALFLVVMSDQFELVFANRVAYVKSFRRLDRAGICVPAGFT